MTLLGQWWAQTFTLAALAWLVAVPLSGWFARVPWTTREPVAALLVWQAVGLSGGLAVLTAELTLAASGQDGPWRHRLISVLFASTSVGLPGALGLVLVSLSSLWLLGVLMMSFIRAAVPPYASRPARVALAPRPRVRHHLPRDRLWGTSGVRAARTRPPRRVVDRGARHLQ
jgi:hypothetical protein